MNINLIHRLGPVRSRVILTLAAAVALTAACNRVDSAHNGRVDSTMPASTPADTAADVPISSANVPKTCPLDTSAWLVTARGIGPAQLGMPIKDMEKLCAVRDSALREDEGQPGKAYVVSVGPGPASILIFVDETTRGIRQVASVDSIFRTSAGVGVGSTVGKLKRGHGRLCGGLGPTGIEVWAISLPGVVLGTTAYPPKMPGSGTGLARNASAVPDTAHVTTVAVSTAARSCAT